MSRPDASELPDAAPGVNCTVQVPADYQPGPHGDDAAALALIRLQGLEALQADRSPTQDAHIGTADWRMQAQLDLALDALRELQRHLMPLPTLRSLSLSPGHVQLSRDAEDWPAALAEGQTGWLRLWLDVRMPQPILLPVVAAGRGLDICPVAGELDAAIESLIFRLHRREIARHRRIAAPAPLR
jgi:hypothetical protein